MSAIKRRNRISGQFAARLIEMLESPAYRALSRSAHMVISRVEIELGHHGGNDNGRLPITTNDFVEYGMHRCLWHRQFERPTPLDLFVSPCEGAEAMLSMARRIYSA
jgi:hypothetical protein